MSRSTKISTLILAFATAAVLVPNAAAIGARADNGATGGGAALEIPYLSHGAGITREVPTVSQSQSQIPYLSHGVGITREAETAVSVSRQGPMDRAHANSSSASTGTPIFRDTPDGLLPRDTVTVSVASGSSVDWSEIALGFSFGLGLAMLAALGVLAMQRTGAFRTQ